MSTYLEQIFGDHFFLIMIRVLVALVLSGLIGFEREVKNHSAGFRTHILVGVGSCLMMLLSLFGFESFFDDYENIRFDPARIPSYVISGIGFLGAGTIIVYGGTIRGLTTAASIWTVAGIGLVVGAGMYGVAIFTTLVILLSLIFLNNFEKRFTKKRSTKLIEIVALSGLRLNDIVAVLERFDLTIWNIEIIKLESDMKNIFLKIEKDTALDYISLVEEISKIAEVKNITDLK